MSAEEFWHGEPRLAVAYRESFKIRRENVLQAEWRAGRYAFEALLAASPAFREFSKGIEHDYPSEPLFTTSETQQQVEEMREKAAVENMMSRFEANVTAINKRFKEQGD